MFQHHFSERKSTTVRCFLVVNMLLKLKIEQVRVSSRTPHDAKHFITSSILKNVRFAKIMRKLDFRQNHQKLVKFRNLMILQPYFSEWRFTHFYNVLLQQMLLYYKLDVLRQICKILSQPKHFASSSWFKDVTFDKNVKVFTKIFRKAKRSLQKNQMFHICGQFKLSVIITQSIDNTIKYTFFCWWRRH